MDRKLLFAILMSLSTIWIYNYFGKKDKPNDLQNIRPGQAYSIPSAADIARPINVEVDFVDNKITEKEVIKHFQTDFCNVAFSNYGGVISDIEFKKHLGKSDTPLRTIYKKSFYEREQTAFLLALDEKTPYFYKFVDSNEHDDSFDVTYSADSSGWLIKKTYTFYKDSYKVDLDINFEKGRDAKTIRPRLFFPAPFVGELDKDIQGGVVGTLDGKSVEKVPDRNLDKAWITPSIFGSQDKYFLHSLISDKDGFVQRGFYKKSSEQLFTVLEGSEVNKNLSTHLSFYIGPKLVSDINAVDPRLEAVLDFGWLSWLCKLLLELLQYLYSLLGNFGLAIIAMTVLLKIPFMPLAIAGRRKMEEYQKHAPALNRIKQKYKGDSNRMNMEIMKFHKERGLSPTAQLSGCLPMIIQMPIMFSLYRVLGNYVELYQAPFVGWITNLSAPDPYYVLPILMGLSGLAQQMFSPMQKGGSKAMTMVMPVFMVAIFINFPAGAVLYWFMNNLLTIGEDFLRKKVFS